VQPRDTERNGDAVSYCFDGATPWTRSRLRSVKRHGGVAVSVYIVGTPGGMRCAVKADVDLARSMGLGVLPNWERAADFFSPLLDRARLARPGVEALVGVPGLTASPDDGTHRRRRSRSTTNIAAEPITRSTQRRSWLPPISGPRRPLTGRSPTAQPGFLEYLAAHRGAGTRTG
jgi:hypothetical protein